MTQPAKKSQKQKLTDTLRLSDEQWGRLSDLLDAQPTAKANNLRRYERVAYRRLSQIAVAFKRGEDDWATFIVRSLDLSPNGIRFIHGTYTYVGSACRVILKAGSSDLLCVEGVVRRCGLIEGTAHDIGVEFDQTIDIAPFVGEEPG